MTDAEHVEMFYRVFLGREPDHEGLEYHVSLIACSGGDLRPAIQSILTSPEYQSRQVKPAPIPVAAFLKRPLTIVDVGAQDLATEEHVYEPLLRCGAACECIGFEPLAHRRAEREARDGTRIRLLPHFIGDGSEQQFYVNNEDNASSLLPLNRELNAALGHLRDLRTVRIEQVRTSKLDEVLADVPTVDFLKLDIQGFELPALHGAIEVLRRTNVVHCEVEFAPIYEGQALFSEVERFLRERGFEFIDFVTTMRYPYAAVPDATPHLERLCWADAVFFRPVDGSTERSDAVAQAIIASHVYGKNGLAKHILARAGQIDVLQSF